MVRPKREQLEKRKVAAVRALATSVFYRIPAWPRGIHLLPVSLNECVNARSGLIKWKVNPVARGG